jgi:hypothetical protein
MSRGVEPAQDPSGGHVPWWHSFRAVAWSFFGIRRSAGHAHDMQHLNPVHVIVAGLVSAAAFVGLLVLVVRWVVGSGVAT